MKLSNGWKLLITVVVSQLAGIIGTVFTRDAIPTWYAVLEKPLWSPPNAVFGPVWITLYLLMGIAAFLVWKEGSEKPAVKKALAVFGGQLVLNTAWSIIFFGMRAPGAALVEISILWMAIALTIVLFWKVSRTAAVLLVPYILWVSFAWYLNYGIWALN